MRYWLVSTEPLPEVGPFDRSYVRAWVWAACCAVVPLRVPVGEAMRLRAELLPELPERALHQLRAASVDLARERFLAFAEGDRERLVARLRAEEPGLFERAVEFWRGRLDADESDDAERAEHRAEVRAGLGVV